MSTKYYALVELPGETRDDPGALVRVVRDGDGMRWEILLADGTWDDRSAALCGITMMPEGDAKILTDAQAEKLIKSVPWKNLRTGLRPPYPRADGSVRADATPAPDNRSA